MNAVQQRGLRVVGFYVIAVSFAFVFRVPGPEWLSGLGLPEVVLAHRSWLAALGPCLGALAMRRFAGGPRGVTLLGTSWRGSALMAAAPLVAFAIAAASFGGGPPSHGAGLGLGAAVLAYCVLEETGWRGYLQDELQGLRPVVRYGAIGLLWHAWHLNFVEGGLHLRGELTVLVLLVLGSWGIGTAVVHTRSIVVAACIHMTGNILAFSSLIKAAVGGSQRLAIVAGCVAWWTVIMFLWERLQGPGDAASPAAPDRSQYPVAEAVGQLEAP